MFGRVTEGEPSQIRSRLLRRKSLVERSFGVRVQIVADERDSFAGGIARIQQAGNLVGPIHFGPPLTGSRLSEPRQGFGKHEDARRAVAFVLVVNAFAVFLRRCNRRSSLLKQLDGLFVHAQHGMFRVVGFGVGFEHLFHASHELGVLLGRNHPVLDLPLRHAVFLMSCGLSHD